MGEVVEGAAEAAVGVEEEAVVVGEEAEDRLA